MKSDTNNINIYKTKILKNVILTFEERNILRRFRYDYEV